MKNVIITFAGMLLAFSMMGFQFKCNQMILETCRLQSIGDEAVQAAAFCSDPRRMEEKVEQIFKLNCKDSGELHWEIQYDTKAPSVMKLILEKGEHRVISEYTRTSS